ncbi:hypothetical protein BMR08_15700 [Methylococcaceae bacterium CS2]|nr:hypothetical protein BMR08_15700 [Methylococcaceae bacterium CS2]
MAIGKISRTIAGEIPETTQEFIANSENYIPPSVNPFDSGLLKDLTLDELASRYHDIDHQSQLFKGQILLEARNRFQSNIDFGKWLSVNFTELNSSNTGKLINLAKFFNEGRSLDGIPVSAGYLLAAPGNKDIAPKIYDDIKEKDLKLEEIKEIINGYKSNLSKTVKTKKKKNKNNSKLDVDVLAFVSNLLEKTFIGKSDAFITAVLEEALRILKIR